MIVKINTPAYLKHR